MRLAATNPQPFQLDVAATSSIPSRLPKISVDTAVAAKGTGQFMPAFQDTLRNKLKGTAFAHSADGAPFAFAWERSTKWLGKTFTDICCDEEKDDGTLETCAPKTRTFRGCSLWDLASLRTVR
jgi:hypothetical protein